MSTTTGTGFNVAEYTPAVLSSCPQDNVICKSIKANLMLLSLLRQIRPTTGMKFSTEAEEFAFYVAEAISAKYDIRNLTGEMLTPNYNLKSSCQARITPPAPEVATADTTSTYTLEECQEFYNEQMKFHTDPQIAAALRKNGVSEQIIAKVCPLSVKKEVPKKKLVMA